MSQQSELPYAQAQLDVGDRVYDLLAAAGYGGPEMVSVLNQLLLTKFAEQCLASPSLKEFTNKELSDAISILFQERYKQGVEYVVRLVTECRDGAVTINEVMQRGTL